MISKRGVNMMKKIVEGDYTEKNTLNDSKTLTLQGGWDSTFTIQSATSVLNSMTLNDDSGTTEIENIILQ